MYKNVQIFVDILIPVTDCAWDWKIVCGRVLTIQKQKRHLSGILPSIKFTCPHYVFYARCITQIQSHWVVELLRIFKFYSSTTNDSNMASKLSLLAQCIQNINVYEEYSLWQRLRFKYIIQARMGKYIIIEEWIQFAVNWAESI